MASVFKVTFSPQDDNLDVTTYTVLLLEKNFVQIHELAPGTAYLFRVQVLSSDNSPGGSSMEEQFETLIEGKCVLGGTRKRVACEMFMNGPFFNVQFCFFFFFQSVLKIT